MLNVIKHSYVYVSISPHICVHIFVKQFLYNVHIHPSSGYHKKKLQHDEFPKWKQLAFFQVDKHQQHPISPSPPASKPGRPQLKQITFWSLVGQRFFSLWSITYLQWHGTQPSTAMKDYSLHLSYHTSGRQGTLRDSTCFMSPHNSCEQLVAFQATVQDEKNPCCPAGELPPEMIFYNLMGKDRRRTSAGKKNRTRIVVVFEEACYVTHNRVGI